MICPKCSNEGVRNEVLGKEFYYCRTCKDEITRERVNVKGDGSYRLVDRNGQWYWGCSWCEAEDGQFHDFGCKRPKVAERRHSTAFETGLNNYIPTGSGVWRVGSESAS